MIFMPSKRKTGTTDFSSQPKMLSRVKRFHPLNFEAFSVSLLQEES